MINVTGIHELLPRRGEVIYAYGGPPPGLDVMWRAEAPTYSVVYDYETGSYGSSDPVIEMRWYEVKKRTRCGARLANDRFTYTDKRVTAREWASNTPAEALTSFRERRKRQISILKAQLRRAEIELAMTEGAAVGTPPAHQPYTMRGR